MAGGGPIGNTKGLALKDPEMRQRAYKSFCEHLAQGKSIKSWWFEEGNNSCTYKTILEYIKDKEEFPSIHKEIAECKGFNYWETIVAESAIGKNRESNTACLQMLMRNKFGWDKDTTKNQSTNIPVYVNGKLATGINVSTEGLPSPDNQSP